MSKKPFSLQSNLARKQKLLKGENFGRERGREIQDEVKLREGAERVIK